MLNEESLAVTLAYLTRWLLSIQAAKDERKKEAAAAVRQIVVAVNETSKYLAELTATGKTDSRIEARLAREWTKLSHLMRNIGNAGLSKRCLVKGGLFKDAAALPAEYIEKSKAELAAVETLAAVVLPLTGG